MKNYLKVKALLNTRPVKACLYYNTLAAKAILNSRPVQAWLTSNDKVAAKIDFQIDRLKKFWSIHNNQDIYWWIYNNAIPLDYVQNDVSKEVARFDDYRAHLRRLESNPQSTHLLSKGKENNLLLESPVVSFYLPKDLRTGLLGIPDLITPMKFEDFAQSAVKEAKRLLMDPKTFQTPKRAVQTSNDNVPLTMGRLLPYFTRQLHPSPRWRLGAIEAVQHIQTFIDQVNVDSLIYEKLKSLEAMSETKTGQQVRNFHQVVEEVKKKQQSEVNQKTHHTQEKNGSGGPIRIAIKKGTPSTIVEKEQVDPYNEKKEETNIHGSNDSSVPGQTLESDNATEKDKKSDETHCLEWFEEFTDEERIVLTLMRESMEQQGVHIGSQEGKLECLELLKQSQSISTSLLSGMIDQHQDLWISRSTLQSLGLNTTHFASRRISTGELEVNIVSDSPVADDLLKRCPLPTIRQEIYKAQRRQSSVRLQNIQVIFYFQRADKQVQQLIKIRQQLAQFRGFDNWSCFSKREGIFKTDNEVYLFVERCLNSLLPGLEREFEVLREVKRKWNSQHSKTQIELTDGYGGPATVLQPWDIPFFMTQLRRDLFSETNRKIRERFTVGTLIKFYATILNTIFGDILNPQFPQAGETWDWSIMKFELLRNSQKINSSSAHLYLDLFDRQNKPQMDAQFSIRGSRIMNFSLRHHLCANDFNFINIYKTPIGLEIDSELESNVYRQPPCCVLTSNIVAPLSLAETEDLDKHLEQTHLSPSQARNLFHELGHVTHAMYSLTGLQHLSGTRGAVDFTEFPSHLFEHFILDPQSLSHQLAMRQGDRKLLDSYLKGSQFMGHIEAASLALKTAVDQIVHTTPLSVLDDLSAQGLDLQTYVESELEKNSFYKILNSTLVDGEPNIRHLIGTPLITKFDHLVNYGGMFHAYLFNRVASSWIWHGAFKGALWNDKAGGQRLKKLLQEGSIDTSLKPLIQLFPENERQLELVKYPAQISLKEWKQQLLLSLP